MSDAVIRPADLSRIARQAYAGAPFLMKWMQTYRPYICPFERLVQAVPPDSEVLDIGCGSALFLVLLSRTQRLKQGFGVDTSPMAITAARSAIGAIETSPGDARIQVDLTDATQFDSGKRFDVVSLIDLLHHVPIPARRQLILDACAQVKPGGPLIYKDIASRPLWRAWMNRTHDLVMARQYVRYTPIAEVERWAAEIGLHVEQASYIPLLWYGHDLRVFRRPTSG